MLTSSVAMSAKMGSAVQSLLMESLDCAKLSLNHVNRTVENRRSLVSIGTKKQGGSLTENSQ